MGLRFKAIEKLELDKPLTNQYFEGFLATSDQWIQTRTGIRQRYFSQMETSEMALACARKLAYDPQRLDMILVASFTPDLVLPSLAAKIHQELAIKSQCFTADINIACTGFVGALVLAEKYLDPGRQALIIGSEKISTVLDLEDRTTAVLFGDGCGGVVVEKDQGAWTSQVQTLGNDRALALKRSGYLTMEGREVYRFAIDQVSQSIQALLDQEGLGPEDLAYVFAHQANQRILDQIARRLGLDPGQMLSNIGQYGNTSAASIPLLLAENKDRLRPGQRLVFTAFGAGLTVTSILMEWIE